MRPSKYLFASGSLALLAAAPVPTAFGQDVATIIKVCGEASKIGQMDTSFAAGSEEEARSMAAYFCQTSSTSYQESQNTGANASFPIQGLPAQFGFSNDDAGWRQTYNNICSTDQNSMRYKRQLVAVTLRANPGLIDAFKACLPLASQTKNGLFGSISVLEAKIIKIKLDFNGNGLPQGSKATMTFPPTTTPAGALDCNPIQLNAIKEVQTNGLSLSCTRTTKDGIAITFNSDYQLQALTPFDLPKIKSPDRQQVFIDSQGRAWEQAPTDPAEEEMWAKEMTWADAKTHCELPDKPIAGVAGWELPSVSDFAIFMADMSGQQIGNIRVGNAFWTSTEIDATHAYYFENSQAGKSAYPGDKAATENLRAWCIWKGEIF